MFTNSPLITRVAFAQPNEFNADLHHVLGQLMVRSPDREVELTESILSVKACFFSSLLAKQATTMQFIILLSLIHSIFDNSGHKPDISK